MLLYNLRLLVSINHCGLCQELIVASLVTRPASFPDSRHNLVLNCLVLGDSPQHIFPVKINKAESVGTLKKAIRDDQKPAFDQVPATTLTLWKVSLPVDGSLEQSIDELNLVDGEALLPVEELSEIFPDPARKYLHIVVRCPPSGKSARPFSLVALHEFCRHCNT
jgi:hypothetical protein